MPGGDDAVLQTIVAHCADPQFKVSALAEKLGRSASYLCEQAHSKYGMSMQQVIETVRLGQAIKLLAKDGSKIDYVRTRVGYMYAKSFRRVFIRRLGLTPCECRERILAAEDKANEVEQVLEHLWTTNR